MTSPLDVHLETMPVFSLDDVPKNLLSTEVCRLFEPISRMLRCGIGMYGNTSVRVGPIPGDLGLISGFRKERREVFEKRLIKTSSVPASAPFLVGLLSCGAFISARMQDALSIELFDFSDTFVFTNNTGKKHQLCLKRKRTELILDVSLYVREHIVNYSEGFSASAIRGLFYADHKEIATPMFEDVSFEGKMIG